MDTESFNRNEKQQFFSTIKGVLKEKNIKEKYSTITLEVGHEKPRPVNMVIKNSILSNIEPFLILGDKISVAYYITSRKVNDNWYTTANVLNVEKKD
jgi:hypothetical protein